MSEYRKQSDGTLVVGASAFKSLFPNTSFPRVLNEALVNDLGYDWVYEGAQPSTTPPYQKVERDGVEQVSGRWQTKYKIGPTFTDTKDEAGNVTSTAAQNETAYRANVDDNAARYQRAERDKKLAETDFYALSDVTMSSDMTTYRQALRDLPANDSGWPHNVTWPTKP
tara:strand:+ start:4197 stop:4700 length:504 start_codon:yes stop_codon:yes gene_type:complete